MIRTVLALLCLTTTLSGALAGQTPLPNLIEIPAGDFVSGSDRAERDYAYMLDAAGQIYEWTATTDANGNVVVKGGSWDDKSSGERVYQADGRHTPQPDLKHILIGFRLMRE